MPFVDQTSPVQKNPDSGRDSRYASLIKFIKWQGRILVLLLVALALVFFAKKIDIHLPSQEPVKEPPPLTEQTLQYILWAYQDTRNMSPGTTVTKPEMTIIGQVYDFQDVIKKWPDAKLTINGAKVELSTYGTCSVDVVLEPGTNVFSSALLINGQNLQNKQMTFDYVPSDTTEP